MIIKDSKGTETKNTSAVKGFKSIRQKKKKKRLLWRWPTMAMNRNKNKQKNNT